MPAAAATRRAGAKCTSRATRENSFASCRPNRTGPSGIGVDEDNRPSGSGSTYSREIIRSDAKTGETIEKHFTPGAGVIYRRTTDIPARPDTYGRRRARRPAFLPRGARRAARRGGGGACSRGRRQPAGGQGRGQARPTVLASAAEEPSPGTLVRPRPGPARTAMQVQNGKLWVAVPPGRMIYRVDPKTWTVEHMFPTVGFRPHGIGIESPDAKHLWESDTNMGAFFKRDMADRRGRRRDHPSGRLTISARRVGVEGLHLLGRRHRRTASRPCVERRSKSSLLWDSGSGSWLLARAGGPELTLESHSACPGGDQP